MTAEHLKTLEPASAYCKSYIECTLDNGQRAACAII
jgi:hypothetical protein